MEVAVGHTSDPKTVGSQIRKVVERFGGTGVTFVGDRGMIKGPQIHVVPVVSRRTLSSSFLLTTMYLSVAYS